MYDFDRIVKAAESCDFHDAFAFDIKRCENALGMGGLMAINAECWLDVLSAMPDAEIAEYVRTKYKPGLLNPFKGTSLYSQLPPPKRGGLKSRRTPIYSPLDGLLGTVSVRATEYNGRSPLLLAA